MTTETKYFPTITAKTSDEFSMINTKLKTLPDCILNNIENAECLTLLGCISLNIRQYWKRKNESRFYLPSSVTQITQFDDYVGIYAGNFFFKIPVKEPNDRIIDYIILKD